MKFLYLWITLIPLILSISFDLSVGKKLLCRKRFYYLLGIFVVLMLIFDSFLTGLPIVQYTFAHTIGITIGTIPIEDFLYGIAFVITILTIDTLFTYSRKDFLTLLYSSRPFSWVNTAYPAMVALLLARGYFVISDLWYLFYFLLPYNLLVYGVNDVYDFESDSHNPRKQSIEGALLPKKLHLFMLWLSTGLSLLFLPFFTNSLVLLLWYLTAVFLAIAYSVPPLRLKTKPVLDSMTSSLHFVLPAVLGFMIGEGKFVWRIEFLSFFLWGMASHMLGAIPDIIPDKKAGMKTVATILGEKLTGILVLFLYGLSAVILFTLNKEYVGIAIAMLLYAMLPVGLLTKRISVSRLFRIFMYYNLVVGFVITMTVIFVFMHIC